MKKVLITVILTFITLISFLSTNVFAVTVTEESFQKSINNTFNLKNKLVEIDTKNDVIKILDTNTNVKYDFKGNPKFSVDFNFTNKMTENEWKTEGMKFMGLVTAFSIVANHFGVEPHDAAEYFVSGIGNTGLILLIYDDPFPKYTNGIGYAKVAIGESGNFTDNDLFDINFNKILETTENYKAQLTLTVDLSGDFSQIKKSGTTFEDEMDMNDALLDTTDKANKEYEEALKKEQEQLNKYEATVEAEILIKNLKEYLNIDRTSVQIDNKLYLECHVWGVYDIYGLMTSNASELFEKNTNSFRKGDYYYYDTGRVRTLPVIYNTDKYTSELQLTSATEEEATFDVIIKNIKTGKTYQKYTDGLKIVKVDGEYWKIDSLKFKTKVEKEDTYPEYVVIEKEEKTENKQEDNKTEETKKEETTKNEVNEVVNTNKTENVNKGNNVTNIEIQDTNSNAENERKKDLTQIKYLLYSLTGVIAIVLIYIVYKVIKYSKKDNDNNML